jgi:gliding motility-associated-like protein
MCEGDSVVLTASSGSAWLWSTGETTQSIVVHSSGNYSVNVTNACGTSLSPVVVVNVNTAACVAGFSHTFQLNNYTFTNTSTGATGYSWNFGDDTLLFTEMNPTHLYAQPGTYLVTLIANNGCRYDTISEWITIANETIAGGFFNGFSPNNDGHNDYWNIPMLDNYPSNQVTIINRWGHEVWQGENYDNSSVVWTGKNLNGDDLPDGTYYFIITYKGQEKRGWVFIKR